MGAVECDYTEASGVVMPDIAQDWECHKQTFLDKHNLVVKHQVGLPPLLIELIKHHSLEALLSQITVQEVLEELKG